MEWLASMSDTTIQPGVQEQGAKREAVRRGGAAAGIARQLLLHAAWDQWRRSTTEWLLVLSISRAR